MRDVDELTALPANPPAPLPSVPRTICSESVPERISPATVSSQRSSPDVLSRLGGSGRGGWFRVVYAVVTRAMSVRFDSRTHYTTIKNVG